MKRSAFSERVSFLQGKWGPQRIAGGVFSKADRSERDAGGAEDFFLDADDLQIFFNAQGHGFLK